MGSVHVDAGKGGGLITGNNNIANKFAYTFPLPFCACCSPPTQNVSGRRTLPSCPPTFLFTLRRLSRLLQLVFSCYGSDMVIILDLLRMKNAGVDFDPDLSLLFTTSTDCLVLGFSSDILVLNRIFSSLIAWSILKDKAKDLCTHQSLSLSRLSSAWLGKPLDKSERMSDWAKRALTKAML